MLKRLNCWLAESNDPVENVFRIYNGHSSIKKIKETINANLTFNLSKIELVAAEKEIKTVNGYMVGTFQNLPIKCLKKVCFFPQKLKITDISPVASAFLGTSNIFGKLMQKQINKYI